MNPSIVKSVFKAGYRNPAEIEPEKWRKSIEDGLYLEVSEMFYDTIQGEGAYIGHPAVFLRLQHCTMTCRWCDTTEVWRFGHKLPFYYIIEQMKQHRLFERFNNNHHLVITGGSPLLQQKRLCLFIALVAEHANALSLKKPFVEIENECTIKPSETLLSMVDCWNNSPKLLNSGNLPIIAYQPEILQSFKQVKTQVWWKFVVSSEEDWDEINENYIMPGLIEKTNVILMPLGGTREELVKHTHIALELAINKGVLYRGREHVMIWDKKTGV